VLHAWTPTPAAWPAPTPVQYFQRVLTAHSCPPRPTYPATDTTLRPRARPASAKTRPGNYRRRVAPWPATPHPGTGGEHHERVQRVIGQHLIQVPRTLHLRASTASIFLVRNPRQAPVLHRHRGVDHASGGYCRTNSRTGSTSATSHSATVTLTRGSAGKVARVAPAFLGHQHHDARQHHMRRTRACHHRATWAPTPPVPSVIRSFPGHPFPPGMPTSSPPEPGDGEHTGGTTATWSCHPRHREHRGHSGPYLPIKMLRQIDQATPPVGMFQRDHPGSPQACAHTDHRPDPMSAPPHHESRHTPVRYLPSPAQPGRRPTTGKG